MYNYDMLPEHMRPGMRRYVENGDRQGDFLMAVLTNNLTESFGRADHLNLRAMETWAQFLRWELPSNCHGSPQLVKEWMEMGGEAGQARLEAIARRKAREEKENANKVL